MALGKVSKDLIKLITLIEETHDNPSSKYFGHPDGDRDWSKVKEGLLELSK